MAEARASQGPNDLATLFRDGALGPLTDGELLGRFFAGNEVAFEILVERHGPMVHRVCLRVLNDPHNALDALQATFLVLVLRGDRVRKRDSVASWLFGVAHRISLRARADAARRRKHEQRGAAMRSESIMDRSGDSDDLVPIVHEEVARLPEKYRQPVVLCDLEGSSYEEAARALGWPLGTLKTRLSRARGRLRDRLKRRGFAVPGNAPLTSLISSEGSITLPRAFARSMARAATEYARGGAAAVSAGAVSAHVVALTEGLNRVMMLSSLKLIAAGALGLIVATAGIALGIAPVRDGMMTAAATAGPEPAGADRTPLPLPVTGFFSTTERARSFAYVIDRSGSMATRGALAFVKLELSRSVGKLTPDARFSVVFYNLRPTIFSDAQGHPGTMAATVANKASVRTQLDAVDANGGTDHMTALRASLREKPEVIFFVTDADLMSDEDVKALTAEVGKARVHVAEFGKGPEHHDQTPLHRLALATGGTYRYFNIEKLPRPNR